MGDNNEKNRDDVVRESRDSTINKKIVRESSREIRKGNSERK